MIFRILKKIRKMIKKVMNSIFPSYRVARRVEQQVDKYLKAISAKQEALFWIEQNRTGEPLSETKKRVFSEMPASEGVLRESQLVINYILQEMDEVCRENDIKYWLMGGTLIGAIRHKGFIPWDGDADIGMMREDYEKLKQSLESNLKIEILEYYNFNNYYRIPKIVIRNSNAKLVVDIIVFDYTWENNFSMKELWKQQQKIRKKYIGALKRFRIQVLDMVGTEQIKNTEKLKRVTKITNNYIEKCHYSLKNGDIVIWGIDNFTSKAVDRRRIYRKNSIFPLKELEFEKRNYYVPCDYMDMITREAGDIWTFPSDIGTPKQFSIKRFSQELESVKKVMKE